MTFQPTVWSFMQRTSATTPSRASRWGLATLQDYGPSPVKYRLRRPKKSTAGAGQIRVCGVTMTAPPPPLKNMTLAKVQGHGPWFHDTLGGGFNCFKKIFTPNWGWFPFWLIFFRWVLQLPTRWRFQKLHDFVLELPWFQAWSALQKQLQLRGQCPSRSLRVSLFVFRLWSNCSKVSYVKSVKWPQCDSPMNFLWNTSNIGWLVISYQFVHFDGTFFRTSCLVMTCNHTTN